MFRRPLYLLLGILSVFLGIIGLFLPLVPTTPFLLLAAWFFSNSSEKLHALLLQSPVLGGIICDWERGGFIHIRTKWIATLMLVGLMSYPILFLSFPFLLKIVAVCTAGCVLIFLWRCPSQVQETLCSSKVVKAK